MSPQSSASPSSRLSPGLGWCKGCAREEAGRTTRALAATAVTPEPSASPGAGEDAIPVGSQCLGMAGSHWHVPITVVPGDMQQVSEHPQPCPHGLLASCCCPQICLGCVPCSSASQPQSTEMSLFQLQVSCQDKENWKTPESSRPHGRGFMQAFKDAARAVRLEQLSPSCPVAPWSWYRYCSAVNSQHKERWQFVSPESKGC